MDYALRRIWSVARVLVASGLIAAFTAGAANGQGFPTVSPSDVGMSAVHLGRMQLVLQDYVDRAEVAGALAMVLRDGKLVALDSAGYADVEGRRPMGRAAIFRMMSMSKPLTAVAAMILVEEGKIALSDPVSRY